MNKILKPKNYISGLVLLSSIISTSAMAQGFWLVTQAEYLAEQSKPVIVEKSLFGAKKSESIKGAPSIELLSPNIVQDDKLASPMTIELVFKTHDNAKINTDSFKVLYGMFKLDITDRIAGSASITPAGLKVSEANLPEGSHSITIEIQDDQKRTGSMSFDFTVAKL